MGTHEATTSDRVPSAGDSRWIVAFDRHVLWRMVRPRVLDVALESECAYVEPPRMDGDVVRAVLRDPESGSSQRVDLARVADDVIDGTNVSAVLRGDCSRCVPMFGPCHHVVVLALDVASSATLREALASGASTEEFADEARTRRQETHREVTFETSLATWLAPTQAGARIEIAAHPARVRDVLVGAQYGERAVDPAASCVVVAVRPRGQKKLLGAREIVAGANFARRDREVLGHTRERGSGRRATIASSVDASLLLEAMRTHGGVFGEGHKALLDFRAGFARPQIRFGTDGTSGPRAEDALSAHWKFDDGRPPVPFERAHFFPGPFPFVWTEAGAIYRVAKDVDTDFASELAKTPVLWVPPGRLRDAGSRLHRATHGRGVELPDHEAFGLPPLETPRIVLRLAGEPLSLRGELVAVYRAHEIDLGDDVDAWDPSVDAVRDLPCERRGRAAVERAGLVRLDPTAESPTWVVSAQGEEAIRFWQGGLADLRAESDPVVHVELSKKLARVHVGDAVTGHVKVGLEGDWLDTRVEFRAGELAVELVRIRSALARKDRWVVLDDGTLARISSSIERLVEEVGEVFGDADGGTLPVHQFGRLERWLEENDGRTDVALRALRKRLRALEVTEPVVPVGLRATLRPYQRHGLAWLQFLDALGAGGILADDMGLGKTVTTLAFVLASKERAERTERARKRTRGKVSSVPKRERHGPTLVVCPTSVIATWVGESKRFTPDLRVHVLHGPKRDVEAIRDADLVVTTYAILRRDADALAAIRFRLAVLDEAQNVKNAQSATTRAANRLDATMRVALTGTPMENRLHELWSIASFANPGILGTARSFEHRFERPIVADRTSAVVHELRAVVRPFLLRRTKAEVLSDLPPKTEIDRVVSLSVRDKRLYDALALTIRSSLAEDIRQRGFAASSLSVFTALTRLRQMACDPRLVDGTVGNGSFDMSAKREAFLELVRELVAERRRALVFSQFVSLLTLWRKDLDAEGIAYEYLDGSTRDRAAVVDRFQEGTSPLFLISLKAGGAGLNLTAADTVIHCDPWWNPAVEDQATDRAYRIGQDKPVTVVRLVARGTIEEKIESLKGKKRELTKIVVEGEGRALDGLTEEDVRMLLGDADAVDDDGDADDDDRGAAELLADESRVLHPEFDRLVRTVSRFHRESGRTEAELSAILHVPTVIVGRLLLGRPFPCSRALASSIVDRIRKF